MSTPQLSLVINLDAPYWAEHPSGARVPIEEAQVLDFARAGWTVTPIAARVISYGAPYYPSTKLEGGGGPAADPLRTVGRFDSEPAAVPPPPAEIADVDAATEEVLQRDKKAEPPPWDGAYVKATHLTNRGAQARLLRCVECGTPFSQIAAGQVRCLDCRRAVRG